MVLYTGYISYKAERDIRVVSLKALDFIRDLYGFTVFSISSINQIPHHEPPLFR